MEKSIKKEINRDKQIVKFCLYGFLKDIKFFDAYIVLFFLMNGFTYLQIGTLVSIKEIIIFVFEIPSGIISDKIGRKLELLICFIFYIASFIVFSFAKIYVLAGIAMALFGLGEAFRSGSHKAMIYTYLDKKEWTGYKSYVYGKTRSASLFGAGISSVLSVLIVIFVKDLKWVFLASIIPYVLDFILILTYPNYLNFSFDLDKKQEKGGFKALKDNIFSKDKGKNLSRLLFGEGVFTAGFNLVKDYIQPVFESIIIGFGILVFTNLNAEENLKIVLGVVYMINSLIGAFVTKNAYVTEKYLSKNTMLNITYIGLLTLTVVASISYPNIYIICILFILLYVFMNVRKPLYVNELDDYMDKQNRATMLSIVEGIKSVIVIVISPVLGRIADVYGIRYALIGIVILITVAMPFVLIIKRNKINS